MGTHRDATRHTLYDNLPVVVLEIAMFFQDIVAAQSYRGRFITVKSANLNQKMHC
jgi:hypothetical protein